MLQGCGLEILNHFLSQFMVFEWNVMGQRSKPGGWKPQLLRSATSHPFPTTSQVPTRPWSSPAKPSVLPPSVRTAARPHCPGRIREESRVLLPPSTPRPLSARASTRRWSGSGTVPQFIPASLSEISSHACPRLAAPRRLPEPLAHPHSDT